MCTSKRRVPKNGIFSLSTCASSITSPVLIRPVALSTAAAFWWFMEPRSSLSPHFDGQRSFSGGGDQLGAWASAAELAATTAANPKAMADFLMGFLLLMLSRTERDSFQPACERTEAPIL